MKLNLNSIIKAAVKYGPIVYPIVKKIIDSRSASKPTATRTTRRTK